ncbi:IS66 family insertion sequence element accessory protein TnpB [Mesorhizobium sp. 131-3-5]|uniref:IS66 family insertion sequence element accessory protein TnpB n=1 Tax=Mesorhizobium sp. 131-3-5 TaxID=2744520 RepID=UPI00406D1D5A
MACHRLRRHEMWLYITGTTGAEVLKHNPLGGNLFCFRGKRGNLLRIIWHDGQGASAAASYRQQLRMEL